MQPNVELVIKLNAESSQGACALCHSQTAETEMNGPMLFLEGTDDRVCWGCGYKHKPQLTQIEAKHYLSKAQERKAVAFNTAAAETSASFPPYMHKRQAAEYTSLSTRTLEGRLGEIPHFRVGKKILFKRSELDYWMETYREGNSHNLDKIADEAIESLKR